MKKICIVATNGRSLIDFRGKLIRKLSDEGHEVTCVSIETKEEMGKKIQALGAQYEQVAGDRTGINVFGGLKMIKLYREVFKRLKPDICFLYMSKPIAFGGHAAIKENVPHINVLVNGLENAYYQHGIKDALVRFVMSSFYRHVSVHADNVFMQNKDDYKYFVEHKIGKPTNMVLVNGSGVDMEKYYRQPLPEEPVFLMVARLLWTKGIREYLEAIRIVKDQYPKARFMLVGGLDESAEGLSEEELNRCIRDYDIEYYSFTTDVRPYLGKCSVFVLPSYHEGTPRSVLEAMATGRAIITSDAPGCRETVVEGENGYMVPVGDSKKLADCIIRMAGKPELRESMGERSYQICREKFEVNKVNNLMIEKMI